MGTIKLFAALSLAFSAPLPLAPLLAQAPTSQTTSQPSATIMADLAASAPLASSYAANVAAAALPDEPGLVRPPVSAEFAAIFAVPCSSRRGLNSSPNADSADGTREPCLQSPPNPYARFLDSNAPVPLSPGQKAHLAFHNLKDPGNLATIANIAAFTTAIDSHTAYGPGWKGVGRNAGYSLLQDATGEFFGTFLIPSLTHEDPRYHRMPNAGVPHRLVHAISRTILAQSDTGKSMPNFATLLVYPISAEISNLYVPGINGNAPSTVARFMTGYATDPVDNLITEFLPDVAKRIHVRVIFVQKVLNEVSSDQYSLP